MQTKCKQTADFPDVNKNLDTADFEMYTTKNVNKKSRFQMHLLIKL